MMKISLQTIHIVDKNVNTGKFILPTEKEYYYSMERVVTYEKGGINKQNTHA